jgi:hypothetical protein
MCLSDRKFIKQKQNADFQSLSSQCGARYQPDAQKPAILDRLKFHPKSLVPSISICSETPCHLFYAKTNSDTANTNEDMWVKSHDLRIIRAAVRHSLQRES